MPRNLAAQKAGWLVNFSIEGRFYHHGDSLVGAETFSCKLMLPTNLRTLKLHFFLKDEAGRKNSTVTPGEITSKVTEVIIHYWSLAGYETISSTRNKIAFSSQGLPEPAEEEKQDKQKEI